jgi:hypothetical protein
MWFYKYLLAEVDAIDIEMKGVTLQLINDLTVHFGPRPNRAASN